MQNIFHFCVFAAASVFLNANKFEFESGFEANEQCRGEIMFLNFFLRKSINFDLCQHIYFCLHIY